MMPNLLIFCTRTEKEKFAAQSLWSLEPFMKANGLMASVMEWASKNGPTPASMRVNGAKEKQMDTENCTTLMVTFTKETGLMIKQMEMELTPTQTALSTSDSGETINSMGTDLRHGQTVRCMRANIMRERSMEVES
jgi:hypothetical protein